MHDKDCILNKYLRHCNFNCQYKSSLMPSLSPCEILGNYMNDPCLTLNANIIPIMPILPPMLPLKPLKPLPLIPPAPPLPPPPLCRAIIGKGVFSGIPQIGILGTLLFDMQLENDILQGVGISHNDGEVDIKLIPNTTYAFSYSIEVCQSKMIPESFTALLLDCGTILCSLDLKENVQPGNVVYKKSGSFTTNNNPNQLLKLIMNNSINSQFDLLCVTLLLQATK